MSNESGLPATANQEDSHMLYMQNWTCKYIILHGIMVSIIIVELCIDSIQSDCTKQGLLYQAQIVSIATVL